MGLGWGFWVWWRSLGLKSSENRDDISINLVLIKYQYHIYTVQNLYLFGTELFCSPVLTLCGERPNYIKDDLDR